MSNWLELATALKERCRYIDVDKTDWGDGVDEAWFAVVADVIVVLRRNGWTVTAPNDWEPPA